MNLFDDLPPARDALADDQQQAGGVGQGAGPRPLAERMRPTSIEEIVGQRHLLGDGMPLRKQIENDRLGSIILWGPPGVGKTTIARMIAARTAADFVPFSAVMSGIKEVKAVMVDAERSRRLGRRTVLFVDEIHRFNKAQQDAFLPYMERGDIILIGATTENPSFEINAALLSRSRVYRLESLTEADLLLLVRRALDNAERGLGDDAPKFDDDALASLVRQANGDARSVLNLIESVAAAAPGESISVARLAEILQQRSLYHDKSGEQHFNLISALHKSVRSSQADAAVYWLTRMMEAGEDRMYLARRLVRMAIEDVGLADPRAMEQAIAAMQTVHFLGIPEGDQALVQLAIYLSYAPKSDAAYQAANLARADVSALPAYSVPMHLRNAPTRHMKEWGYGSGYEHAHQNAEGLVAMECLPQELAGKVYYQPTGRGAESRIAERAVGIREWRRAQAQRDASDAGGEPDSARHEPASANQIEDSSTSS